MLFSGSSNGTPPLKKALSVLLAATVSLGVVGCGMGGPKLPKPRLVVDDEEDEAPPAQTAATPTTTSAKTTTKPPAKLSGVRARQRNLPNRYHDGDVEDLPRYQLPESVNDWTLDHLIPARLIADRQLAEAVLALAEKHVGDPVAVQAFERLLPKAAVLQQRGMADSTIVADAQGREVLTPPVIRPLPQLVPALLAGIGRIGGDEAFEIYLKLLHGEEETDMPDRQVVSQVCATLLENPSPQTEELYFEVLTSPETFRTPAAAMTRTLTGQQPLSAELLQSEALRAATTNASRGLKLSIAEWLVGPSVGPQQRNVLLPLFRGDEIDNLPAQAVLFNSGVLPAVEEARLVKQFRERSRIAGLHFLGLNTSQSIPASRSRFSFDSRRSNTMARATQYPIEEQTVLTAQALWAPTMIENLAARATTGEAKTAGDWIALLTSIPSDAARSRVSQFLELHWRDGPAKVKTGFADATDPGVLATVKRLRRDENNYRLDMIHRDRQAWSSKAQRGGDDDLVKVQWTDFVEETARQMMQRVASAAQTPERDGGQSLPWGASLPEGAEVIAEYRGELTPDEVGCEACSLAPTIVHYARVDVKARARAVHGQLLREFKGAVSRPTAEGRWIDWSNEEEEGATRIRTADVFIRASGLQTADAPPGDERLMVELLLIESKPR